MELFDRRDVRLRLIERMLKPEAMKTLLHGCVTWSPSKANYDRLRKVHHEMLLRCLGWLKRKRDDHTLSYANALLRKDSESVETTVRTKDIIRGLRGTHGRRAPADEGDVWGDARG